MGEEEEMEGVTLKTDRKRKRHSEDSSADLLTPKQDGTDPRRRDEHADEDADDTSTNRLKRGPRYSAPESRGDVYYRELYKSGLDFQQMAIQDPRFAAVLKPNKQMDFTDPAAMIQLTKTTLMLDFGLGIELPDDRLCPPVPNRHNYILWLKDMLDSSSYDRPGGKLTGIDIGTGASCIYPLLACTQRPWYFIGTDIDHESLSCAAKNVKLNGLEQRIKLAPRLPADKLVPLDDMGIDCVDFVMTNPPFYESEDEMLSLARKKACPPLSACTGAPVEMVCEGGEVGFVERLLQESLVLKERVRWFTSMLGKVSSLEVLVDRLHVAGVDNYAVTEFVQGNKTRRWAIGWSFGSMRPSQAAARGMAQLGWKKVLPLVVESEVAVCSAAETGAMAAKIDELMQSLELASWCWERNMLEGVARTKENVWGRAWRRKKLREQGEGGQPLPGDSAIATKGTMLETAGFMISITVSGTKGSIFCRWCEGHDEAIFQSFCGFLKTKIGLARKELVRG